MQKTTSILRSENIGKFLVPAGGILILFSIFMFYVVSSSQGYVKTDALVSRTEAYEEPTTSGEEVVDLFDVFENERDKKNTVYVKYTVDGTEYEEVFGILTGYKEGDKIKICYDPDDPTILIQPGSLLHPAVILAVGIAAIIAGIVCLRKDFGGSEDGQKGV